MSGPAGQRAAPSIKGSVFIGVAEVLEKAFANGGASREEAARTLEDSDFSLLEDKLDVAAWYDIGAYDRFNRVLLNTVGQSNPRYWVTGGFLTAQRLREAGLYPQLEYLQRTEFASVEEADARAEALGRDLNVFTTISASILNFSKWRSAPDPDKRHHHITEITEAEFFPDSLAWRSQGFVNGVTSTHSTSDVWHWERTAPDTIVLRMNHPI